MFTYEAYNALRGALIDFFYAEGDVLPFDQAGGVNELDGFFNDFKTEVDRTLLNHKDKKVDRYLADLSDRIHKLNSIFDELYMPLLSFPESQQITSQCAIDADGNISGFEVHSTITGRLASEGHALEHTWRAKSDQGVNIQASSEFFESLTPWQKLTLRYKFVNNVVLGMIEHLVSKRSIWSLRQEVASNPDTIHFEPALENPPLLEWNDDAQQLAELLYMAERAGMLNIKELRKKGVLLAALNKFCEGFSFSKSRIKTPGKAVYNALMKIEIEQLGPGRLDFPRPKDPWGRSFTQTSDK